MHLIHHYKVHINQEMQTCPLYDSHKHPSSLRSNCSSQRVWNLMCFYYFSDVISLSPIKNKQPCSCFARPVSFCTQTLHKTCFMIHIHLYNITTCLIVPTVYCKELCHFFHPCSHKKWLCSTHAFICMYHSPAVRVECPRIPLLTSH